jgi:sulfatase modifying factor 1
MRAARHVERAMSTRPSRVGLAGLLVAAAACSDHTSLLPPAGQILLYFDTDAPLPTTDPSAPPPLFDRVRYDAISAADATACDACTREFDVSAELVQSGASIGILAPFSGGAQMRVRLFRAAVTNAGEPPLDSTIDVTFQLPPIPEEGIVELTALLHVSDVGHPVGTTSPAALLQGRPNPSLVETWPGAQATPCNGEPPPGYACVPGGAYWMGNPVLSLVIGEGPGSMGIQRLVALSPFFVRTREVSVAEYRDSGQPAPLPWSGQRTGAHQDYCTFTTTPGPWDTYPVNCLTWQQAHDFCNAAHAELPTEAEFEFAAGGLAGHDFPWGDDPPSCADAVIARGGYGVFVVSDSDCLPHGSQGGPEPVGTGARDHLLLGSSTVDGLVGNVSEFARDMWQRETDPCWNAPGLYTNPVCLRRSPEDASVYDVVIRGGEWADGVLSAEAAQRGPFGLQGSTVSTQTGFRCAIPAD